MNSVIFLDIDGVLKNPTKTIWYPEALSYLIDYCEYNNIDIVISSNWRFLKEMEFFNKLLNNRVVGVTKDLSSTHSEYTRYYECLDYIKSNNIIDYVILDDKSSEYMNASNLIIVDSDKGVSLETIMTANKILKKSIDYLIEEEIVLTPKY